MTVQLIEILTYLLLAISIFHFLGRNDEFTLLPVLFFIGTGLMRYNAVLSGKSDWVIVAYAFSIFDLNDELALRALRLFFLGTSVFVMSYIIFKKSDVSHTKGIDNSKMLNIFLQRNKLSILLLFGFFFLLNSYFRVVLSGFESAAYGLSYLFLFKLAIGGLVLLVFLLYRSIPPGETLQKMIYLLLLIIAAYVSYNPRTRFQFLSWMMAIGLILMKNTHPFKKIWIYSIGGAFVLLAFAYAGNLRHNFIRKADFKTQVQYAMYRLEVAEDQNMLDGFMMVLQVYPQHLDYGYGSEHFEILLRPIPRALWPEKPVGGYANKLGLNKYMPKGTTVGISQSIYGTFYGEGGTAGIIILSVLYGFIFSRLFQYTNRYGSDMRYVLKGIIFASAVPLLRGGDLPGIIAFIGMSYWPVFLFIFLYNGYIRRVKAGMVNSRLKKSEKSLSQATGE